MADWYVSSVAYAAVPLWAVTTAYTVGQFVRPVTPTNANRFHVYRCTTAGTSGASEPNWTTAAGNNNPIASGAATFTNVTGQSVYGWSAAAGALYSISNAISMDRAVVGDRIFISSDHSESLVMSYLGFIGTTTYGAIQIISVNRAGSVPPVAADVQSGAAIIVPSGGNLTFESYTMMYYQGIIFTVPGALIFNNTTLKTLYFKNCAFVITNAAATRQCYTTNVAKVIWDNTTVQFGHTGQYLASNAAFELIWLNTPSALPGATIPTILFNNVYFVPTLITCRGVDLSSLTGTLQASNTNVAGTKILLDSCRIASGLTRYGSPPSVLCPVSDEVELVNCFDGTNYLNERYSLAGAVTTDRSTTLASGAQDDVGAYSLKLVSSVRADKQTLTLDSFWLDVENITTGSSKTATVEIISSASLNNDDIRLVLEFMGTSGSSLASFSNSQVSILTTVAALPTSSVTWNNPPSTPVKQYLQLTFTPQVAGRVRGLVRLGKVSTTVWINPQIAIT